MTSFHFIIFSLVKFNSTHFKYFINVNLFYHLLWLLNILSISFGDFTKANPFSFMCSDFISFFIAPNPETPQLNSWTNRFSPALNYRDLVNSISLERRIVFKLIVSSVVSFLRPLRISFLLINGSEPIYMTLILLTLTSELI